MVGFNTVLAPTIARPPTPPKESSVQVPNDSANGSIINAIYRPLLDTPEESPSSSAESIKGSSGKLRKKVGFSPFTDYHPMNGHDSDSDRQRKRMPPPKDSNPAKSILKASTDKILTLSNEGFLTSGQSSVPVMLRSTTQHLASTSRASRLDAYSTLLGCLSAYDDVPETQDLVEKVVEITGYIRRDITTKAGENTTLDIQLATQALKVLAVFVYTPRMAIVIPQEFSSFILERSISSIEDVGSPKILVTHYMHLLEKQKFSPNQMNSDRANRLLTALDGVTTRIKSNRIIGHRLMIYHRLLIQAKLVMASRVRSWLDHLIAGMLSSIKDIRSRAIAFGVDAGVHLGTTSLVSQACIDVFNRAPPDGKKFVDFLSSRLIEMIDSKEENVHVPQIWSVVILLLRSRRRQLERWEHIKAWLKVIQLCFNSLDGQVRIQANIAWNRLVFAINIDTSTHSTHNSMATVLREPVMKSLEGKVSEKNTKQAKQIARSSYCTLLYYAFRPTATHAQLDLYWDLYVAQVLPSCFVASKNEVNYACDILAALFSGNGKPKVWDENRANIMGPTKPEELPCLDPKWIRLRAAKVLKTFDKFLDVAYWQLDEEQESPVMVAWRSFTIALGNAGSKEVKTSMETMNAIAQIIDQVKRILDRNSSRSLKEPTGLEHVATDKAAQLDDVEKVRFIVQEAVARIGNIPFAERRVIFTSQDSFEASETPSSRSTRDKNSQNSPATHILNLLLRHRALPGENVNASYRGVLREVLRVNLHTAASRRSRLAILRNQARLSSVDDLSSRVANVIFWQLLAEAASAAMDLGPHSETHNDSPQYPGHEFREAVKILELGLQLHSDDNSLAWRLLHDRVEKSLREEIGDNGVTLVMTEHLAGVVRTDTLPCNDTVLGPVISILDAMRWPQSGHSMERAQSLLWGAVHIIHKGNSVDPFDNLYSMVDAVLSGLYEKSETYSAPNVAAFLSATSGMMRSCPLALQSTTLLRIQRGLGYWIEDSKGILNVSAPLTAAVLPEVQRLSSIVVSGIGGFTQFDSKTLLQYQSLVASGLRSRHKSVLNEYLAMWNRTFGSVESLEYPDDLRPTLSKLKTVTDLQLPGFAESEAEEAMSSPFRFVVSQDDDDDVRLQAAAISTEESPRQDRSRLATKTIPFAALASSPNATAAIPKSPRSARRLVKTTPKARLRHDDSQIRFAAVESSPLAHEPVESQYLTDRQKEVKERQCREAAAMFPDIRSSPKSASRPKEYSLPRLIFEPSKSDPSMTTGDDGTSPLFPPDVLMNDFLGSSPTPSSSKKGTSNQLYYDGPPSSPPFVSSHLNVIERVELPQAPNDSSAGTGGGMDYQDTDVVGETAPATNGDFNSDGQEEVTKAVEGPSDIQEQSVELEAPPIRPDERILSDLDVYVDAPSEPTISQLADEQVENEVSHVTNSFASQGSSRYDTEDDQVAAQLINEMERASSQQSLLLQAITKPLTKSDKPGRKRKGIFDFPPSANKRARHGSGSLSPEQIMDTPKAGQMIADCVMVDTREAPRNQETTQVQIKIERSPSPSVITASQFAEETSAIKRGRGRPRKQQRASQLSREVSPARKSPRLSQIKVEQNDEVAIMATSPAKDTRNRKTPRRSNVSAQQQKRVSRSQDHNSELDTDPLAPDAEDGEMMEGVTALQNVQARPMFHQSSGPNPQEVLPANRDTEVIPSDATKLAETQGPIPTPQGILQGFKDMLASIKTVAFGPEEERAMVGMLSEFVVEVHEAGCRNKNT